MMRTMARARAHGDNRHGIRGWNVPRGPRLLEAKRFLAKCLRNDIITVITIIILFIVVVVVIIIILIITFITTIIINLIITTTTTTAQHCRHHRCRRRIGFLRDPKGS